MDLEKEFKDICQNIYNLFDSLNARCDGEVTYGKEMPLSCGFDYYEWLEANPNLKDLEAKIHDGISEVLYDVRGVFFALGYVIGQSFDLTYPDAQKDVEAIKKVIQDKGLLPYLPREKVSQEGRKP